MVFSSISFVYCFFPLVFLAYFIVPNRSWRNGVLLVSSLIFYAWGEPKFLLLMVAASLCAWAGGLLIHHFSVKNRPNFKKIVFVITVLLLVGNLFVFKYLNFAVDNINALFRASIPVASIVLPIGISFYTFQILSYVIDLYWGKVRVQRNFFWLLLYVSFFPQLIAGPIVRYQTVEQEIMNRQETLDDAVAGFKRFIIGLAKKVLLANGTGLIVEHIYGIAGSASGTIAYWIAALAFTLQIYFDFSGYSDMAIGLGRVFGFHFSENFIYPFASLSTTDFWRRWHVSMASWFRDYVYYPLGGSRVGKARRLLNVLILWALTGFWHGAQWNFLLWGLFYALLLTVEKHFLQKWLDKLPKFFRWFYTIFFFVLGSVLFNLTDMVQLGSVLKTMFVWTPTNWFEIVALDSTILESFVWLPLAMLCAFPILPKLKFKDTTFGTLVSHGLHLALAVICIIFIISSSYNPFIYFRF